MAEEIGNGKIGLSDTEKQNRITKLLGTQSSKKDMLLDKEVSINSDELNNILPNIEDYPMEHDNPTHRVIWVKVNDDGGLSYGGVVLDGKENDPKEITMFGLTFLGDNESAMNEVKSLSKGKLTEVSERTLAIHNDLGTDLTDIPVVLFENWRG